MDHISSDVIITILNAEEPPHFHNPGMGRPLYDDQMDIRDLNSQCRPRSKSREVREFFDSELVGDLEAETKMIRHLRALSSDPFLTREMVGACIPSDD